MPDNFRNSLSVIDESLTFRDETFYSVKFDEEDSDLDFLEPLSKKLGFVSSIEFDNLSR